MSSAASSSVHDSPLAVHAYTDEGFFRRELAAAFDAKWVALCRDDEVSAAGSQLPVSIGERSVVVTCGADRRVRVLANVCLHRSCELVAKPSCSDTIVCPYHGWTYTLDGRLAASPTAPAGLALRELPSFSFLGFRFVSLSGQPNSSRSDLDQLARELAPYELESYVAATELRYDGDWNWKVMIENASEVMHLPLHRRHISAFPGPEQVVDRGGTSYALSYARSSDGLPFATSLPRERPLDAERSSCLALVTLFPNLALVINPDQLTCLFVYPITARRHALRVLQCYAPGATDDPEWQHKKERFRSFFELVHAEDIEICRAVQRGLETGFARPSLLTSMEASVARFHGWLQDAVSARAHDDTSRA